MTPDTLEIEICTNSGGEVMARKGPNGAWFYVPDGEEVALLHGRPDELARLHLTLEALPLSTAEVRTVLEDGAIWQTIEFAAAKADTEVKDRLDALTERVGGRLEFFDEYDQTDRTSYDGGRTWVTGPNHGKTWVQWCLYMPMKADCTLDDIRAAHAYLLHESLDLFVNHGVSVF